jgi:hypothetical protein
VPEDAVMASTDHWLFGLQCGVIAAKTNFLALSCSGLQLPSQTIRLWLDESTRGVTGADVQVAGTTVIGGRASREHTPEAVSRERADGEKR